MAGIDATIQGIMSSSEVKESVDAAGQQEFAQSASQIGDIIDRAIADTGAMADGVITPDEVSAIQDYLASTEATEADIAQAESTLGAEVEDLNGDDVITLDELGQSLHGNDDDQDGIHALVNDVEVEGENKLDQYMHIFFGQEDGTGDLLNENGDANVAIDDWASIATDMYGGAAMSNGMAGLY